MSKYTHGNGFTENVSFKPMNPQIDLDYNWNSYGYNHIVYWWFLDIIKCKTPAPGFIGEDLTIEIFHFRLQASTRACYTRCRFVVVPVAVPFSVCRLSAIAFVALCRYDHRRSAAAVFRCCCFCAVLPLLLLVVRSLPFSAVVPRCCLLCCFAITSASRWLRTANPHAFHSNVRIEGLIIVSLEPFLREKNEMRALDYVFTNVVSSLLVIKYSKWGFQFE